MATKSAIEVRRKVIFAKVLEGIGNGLTIGESCEAAGITHRTFNNWIQQGHCDDELRELSESIRTETLLQIQERWPDILKRTLDDAANVDGKVSVRDRDTCTRTVLQTIKGVIGELPEQQHGESGVDWIKRRGKDFPPIAIVGSNVVIAATGEPLNTAGQPQRDKPVEESQGDDSDIVDGEAVVVEVDSRRMDNPILWPQQVCQGWDEQQAEDVAE